mgnify:CR=1 FL=1
MSEMEQARIKSTNLDYLNKLTKLDLLVIDDFGLMDLDLDKCRDLFEVLDTRDGRKSTVVISQFPVSTWFDMFADKPTLMSALHESQINIIHIVWR